MAKINDCGVCDGSGQTFLYSAWGDPCPECDGRPMRLSSQAKLKAGKSGCPLFFIGLVTMLYTLTQLLKPVKTDPRRP